MTDEINSRNSYFRDNLENNNVKLIYRIYF